LFQICVIAGVWERSVSVLSYFKYLSLSLSNHSDVCLLYFQAIPLAWIVLENYTCEALRAGFHLLKSALPIYRYSKVMSAVDEAGFAFSDVFSVEVFPSLYDFISVSLFACLYFVLLKECNHQIFLFMCSWLPKEKAPYESCMR